MTLCRLNPKALAAAMIAACAVSPLNAETWRLPGGAALEIGAPTEGRAAVSSAFGSGTTIVLGRDSVDGGTAIRLSDGEATQIGGAGLGIRYFFLTLEGRAQSQDYQAHSLTLERLRVGVNPGEAFLGQRNDEDHLQTVMSAERIEARLSDADSGSDVSWSEVNLESAILGALHESLPVLSRRLGVETFGLDGSARIDLPGGNGLIGESLFSVNDAETHRLAFNVRLTPDGTGLAEAELRLSEEGEMLAAAREAGRLSTLGDGLIGAAGRGMLMAAGFGLGDAGQIADTVQTALVEGGTIVLRLAPETPVALDALAGWPDLSLADRRELVALLGLQASREAD